MKVYILTYEPDVETKEIQGVVSSKLVANKFYDGFEHNVYQMELDDPELLDRIAKSENKNE